MAFSRTTPDLDLLVALSYEAVGLQALQAIQAEQRGDNPADGENFFAEHPEDNIVPDVIVSADDPGAGLFPACLLIEDGRRIIQQVMAPDDWIDSDLEGEDSHSEDSDSEDTDSEDTDGSDTWTEESEDSGCSMSEDEEDHNIRPLSPLDQELAPEGFWQEWLQMAHPVSSGSPPLGPPGTHSDLQSPEDLAPSTSGSSLKRGREERGKDQVGTKRQRTSDEDPAPSTSSGLSTSANRRNWHRPPHHTGWSDDSDSD